MKVIRRVRVLSLLVVAALFVQGAGAATTTILPASSHYQGRSYFSTVTQNGFLSGRIEFAVYDTQGGNEFAAAGFTAPGTGQYTYVYQIFNDDPASSSVLEYFSVLGIGESAIANPIDDIGSVDDNVGAVEPTSVYFAPYDPQLGPENAIWEFEGGVLDEGDHSFFLVLSSDHDFTKGTYSIVKSTDPVTPIPNPEPGTIALIGVGAAITLLRRRKSAT
jgi:hypothetical protein